jgi:hypothetical protein
MESMQAIATPTPDWQMESYSMGDVGQYPPGSLSTPQFGIEMTDRVGSYAFLQLCPASKVSGIRKLSL